MFSTNNDYDYFTLISASHPQQADYFKFKIFQIIPIHF